MKQEMYVLIVSLFSATSGNSVAMHEFTSERTCNNAKRAWLQSMPLYREGNETFYDVGDAVISAVCVPK